MEHWKPIPNSIHEVSDQGRVRTPGKGIRKQTLVESRYYKIGLKIDGKTRIHYVHTLVLTTFVGSCPVGLECRHLNDNKRDNRLINLEWGTRLDNMQDRIKHGLTNRGELTARLS